ncbi:unnamed protein product [Calypogeia fissa]
MEDEGGLSFDFEGGLDAAVAPVAPSQPQNNVAPSSSPQRNSVVTTTNNTGGQKASAGRKNYRQTVCRHWLRGLCMKGDACGFLHQYDKARMPVCRFFAKFGECREPDCVYKHTNEDIKECNMYKLGFCPNGPECRYRHQKVPGPPPSVEQNLQKIQHRVYAINGTVPQGGKHPPQPSLPPRQGTSSIQAPNEGNSWPPPPVSTPMRNISPMPMPEDSHNQHPRPQRTPPPPPAPPPAPAPQASVPTASPPVPYTMGNGTPNPPVFTSAAVPLPNGFCRFFIVKSSNRENLELSVERGLWATHRNNESKLNEAYDTCDHVILIFSVNETRHFQGCARMMSKIGGIVGGGGWKYAHGTAHYGRNFRLKWLKMCELTFNKTRHLRNPYNENLPVKISRDCQELEPSVGDQLAQLLYMEPDSELMTLAKEGEAKREEEKVRGGSGQDVDDADMIPFEDNEDDQEEDDSDEDEGSNQTMGPGPAGRGMGPMGGRGQMWGPFGMGRGGRGMGGPGGRGMGFHPDMGEGPWNGNFDRFAMGPGEGFGMGPGDMFHPGGPGRGFPPFGHPGPGFSGPEFPNMGPGPGMNFGPMDGPGPGPGMGFHGRPPPPNGMFPPNGPPMMGPPVGHPPMMGGGPMPHFRGGPGVAGGPGGPGPGGPMGRPPRGPQGGNFRPPFSGGSGRGSRGSGDQKRRRSDRSSGADRTGPGDEGKPTAKQRLITSSTQEGGPTDTEAEFSGAEQRNQGQDGSGYGSAAYTGDNEEDDSESEDEAPRRSRHGEGKKRRRDWDAEDNGGGGERWEQDAEQGAQS